MKTLLTCILLFPLGLAAQPLCGYPGDANNDSTANYLDLLSVGAAYNAEFVPLSDTSTDWHLRCFQAWPFPPTFANPGYSDANGSGFVDTFDIKAITLNYDSLHADNLNLHTRAYNPDTLSEVPCARIRVGFRKDDQNEKKFYADLFLDVDPSGFPGAMAVGMRLKYDPTFILEDSTRVLFDPLAFDLMGVGAAHLSTSLERQLPSGVVDMAVSGRGVDALQGPRLLGSVQFVVVGDIIIRNDTVDFVLEPVHILLITRFEQVICTDFVPDVIKLVLDEEQAPQQSVLRLFPNPAGERLRWSIDAAIQPENIILWNTAGVRVAEFHGASSELDIGYLPPGMYFVQVQSARGSVWGKVEKR